MVPFAKVLLVFSLPLLGGSLFQLVTTWADTLLLGFLRSAEEVAHYNAALPTSKLIQTTMAAFLFLYLPVATSLVSKGLKSEMKRVYAVVSKWVVFINLPLFMVLFLNADTLFLFLYGGAYVSAVLPFRICACGYFLRDFFGPSGGTLIALGKTKTMMMIVSAIAITNLSCNAVLIPRYGMGGAAISMLATLCTAAALRGSILYKTSGIHPFGATFVKPIIPSLLLIGGVQTGLEQVLSLEAWILPALFVVYMGIHGFSLIITKSVDQEDIWMLLIFEKKIGIDLTFLKKIVKKLLR
jgi:O-antigen/teichoic acid export membrane protein